MPTFQFHRFPVGALVCSLIVVFTAEASSNSETFASLTEAAAKANQTLEPIAPGPFEPSWESLKAYRTPEWFSEAKFGIWAHWGPQCQPEMGDWYAQLMYVPNNPKSWARRDYEFHVARYGHPSAFGFKDVIHTWKAEHWDPDRLMALYKRAGAQYFMALANHHDNFDLWNSKYQPWNSTVVGPQKDLIGGWAKAARANGLRFGVSIHAARAWSWYESSQGADASGPLAGVPYDGKLTAADGKGTWWEGLDPQDLYAQSHPVGGKGNWDSVLNGSGWSPGDPRLPSQAYVTRFYNRVADLINQHHPDLIYFDDTVLPFYPLNDVGLRIAAHFYNSALAANGGRLEAVLTGKHLSEEQKRCMVYDIERGRSPQILPRPWQTDTCLGIWHYDRSLYEQGRYKTAGQVIQMLADIVSKNGNLMLNVPVRGDGTIDDTETHIIEQIGDWMATNREAIFATRPWKVYGEGPSTLETGPKGPFDGLQETGVFTAKDIRFTASKDGNTIYAIVLGRPSGDVRVASIGSGEGPGQRQIAEIELLGQNQPVKWTSSPEGIVIAAPPMAEVIGAAVFRIRLKA